MTTDQHDVAALIAEYRPSMPTEALHLWAKDVTDALARLRAERDEWREERKILRAELGGLNASATVADWRALKARAEAAEAERDNLAARLEEAKAVLERAQPYLEFALSHVYGKHARILVRDVILAVRAFLHQGGEDAR